MMEVKMKINKNSEKIVTIMDLDPYYFKDLSNRSMKEKLSLKQYVGNVREILKTKLMIGQKKDNCIRINQQFEQELHQLQKIQHHNKQCMSNFEKFLSEDHQRSIEMLEKAEREIKLTEEISACRNKLSKQYGQSRLDIYLWEENWRMVKMCQIFLYWMSPIAWRIKHNWLHQFESGKSIISIDAIDIFSRFKIVDEDISLESLIELFERDIANAGSSELYFEDPFDLIRVFQAMEMQNLNALTHLESLAGPMTDMATIITETEAQIERETNKISSTIDDLQKLITEVEDRAMSLEKYANYLLQSTFRHFVCSEQVLYLRIFVEDTYENCIGPNDANLDTFTMMKWIERIYEKLNLQLDNMSRQVVYAYEKEEFKQETKIIKEAEDAARKFELMHRLLNVLKRIMQPPIKKKRLLTQRSMPISPKIKLPSFPLQSTNDEARRYFIFFTNYCKYDDFQMYHYKFLSDFDLVLQNKNSSIQVEPMISSALLDQEQEKEEQEKEENDGYYH